VVLCFVNQPIRCASSPSFITTNDSGYDDSDDNDDDDDDNYNDQLDDV